MKSRWGAKTILALIWSLFTITLVSWWIYFLFNNEDLLPGKMQKMFFMEGTFLLLTVTGGSIALLIYSFRDQRRHQQLNLFFSLFSHDLRTSITRLRLQSEILLEQLPESEKKSIEDLSRNINLLDLQLENSLWMSRLEDLHPHFEKCQLSQLIASVKPEFPDLTISLEKDVSLWVDKRFTISVLRNIFNNSRLHGQANHLSISTQSASGKLTLQVADDGTGCLQPENLGLSILERANSKGSGIGLYLSKKMMRKQKGEMSFIKNDQGGLTVKLQLTSGAQL